MQRTGECGYCGQSRMVDAPPDMPQEDVDRLATKNCNCDQAVKVRNARANYHNAMETIANLFVGNEEPLGELFREAYDIIGEGCALRMTLKVDETRTYVMTWNSKESAPQINRIDKQEANTVLG